MKKKINPSFFFFFKNSRSFFFFLSPVATAFIPRSWKRNVALEQAKSEPLFHHNFSWLSKSGVKKKEERCK